MTFGTLVYALLCLIGVVICVFYLEFGTVAIAGILVCIPIFMFLFIIFMRTRVSASVDSKNPMAEKDDMDKPCSFASASIASCSSATTQTQIALRFLILCFLVLADLADWLPSSVGLSMVGFPPL